MFSLTRILAPKIIGRANIVRSLSLTTIRLASDGEDTKVNIKWPRTNEERERAAKKYNLIPEDYEPYPEDEAFGDYPKLKAVGAYNRDRYDDYDMPVLSRFYGEVYHLDADLYYWERIDPLEHEKNFLPLWKQLAWFLSIPVTVVFLYWFCFEYKIHINHNWKVRLYLPPDTKFYEYPDKEMDNHILNNHH